MFVVRSCISHSFFFLSSFSSFIFFILFLFFRIIERTPPPYLDHARGPQNNQKIVLWNQVMNKFATKYSVIDPFNFTKSVVSNVDWYHDTEDGFHMGWWINLQKVQMVIEKFMSVSVVEEVEEVEEEVVEGMEVVALASPSNGTNGTNGTSLFLLKKSGSKKRQGKKIKKIKKKKKLSELNVAIERAKNNPIVHYFD